LRFNPPQVADKDDVTGEDLVRRDDDEEATIRTRLEVYHAQTTQLAEYYSAWADTGDERAPKYRKVDGSGSVEEVHGRILAALA
jgi:adenylate kinase